MYLLVKLLTHFTIWLTCKRFAVYNKSVTQIQTPLIIGCNHPNSFLDAILTGAQMKKRVHFLTRGDVFKNKFVIAIMKSVNMIPIYRIRDGKDNLSKNDVTFEMCREIIKRGEHVLIFVEGFCQHQTSLQTPLKKGAPRLLLQGRKDGIDVQLLPVWVEYNSFSAFPKQIDIYFGNVFGKDIINDGDENGAVMQSINKETERQLLQLSANKNPGKKQNSKNLLLLPAMLGFMAHALLVLPIHFFAKQIKEDIHYDSVMFSAIALLYPIYLLLLAGIIFCTAGWLWALISILSLPLLARAYTLWK